MRWGWWRRIVGECLSFCSAFRGVPMVDGAMGVSVRVADQHGLGWRLWGS